MESVDEKPARAASYQSRAPRQEAQLRELAGPCIGEPWPELEPEAVRWPDNGASVRFHSVADSTKTVRSLTVQVSVKTRLFVIALLFLVAAFAMAKNNVGLLRDVLRVMGGTAQHTVTESPP
jgi:hypothetical protein